MSSVTGVPDVHVVAVGYQEGEDGKPSLHPLRFNVEEGWFRGGQTILEIIGEQNRDCPLVIQADGRIIECEYWHEVVPKKHLVIKRLPADRNALRLLGFIAVAIFAPVIGSSITIGLAQGPMWSYVWTTAAGLVGTLAVNALIPPVLPSIEGAGGPDRLSFITGQSNQVAPFAPIPVVLGKPTYYPPIPMTGTPYTELVGEDQYLRMMVVLGYGPLQIGGVTVGAGHAVVDENTALTGDPIKIGGTSISQFEEVEFEIGDPDDVTLFTSSIVETAVNVALNHTDDPANDEQTISDNVQVTQTTDNDTDEVSGDLYFPQLYTVSGNGNTRFARVSFQVHYSPQGEDDWTLATSFTVASIERKPIRRGFRFRLPSTGQWDIRVTRVSTFYGREDAFFVDCTWTVLRSIKRNMRPFDVDDTVVMALRIRATDQLGGAIDRLSVEAQGIHPIFNGSSWTTGATRNPAWCYAYILSGVATKTPASQSQLDGATLKSWADWCAEEGLTCDLVVDAEGTVFDRAREVASTGLGSWHVTDDAKFSIVRDVEQTPKMVITPRNSFGFTTEYAFHKIPHALRVQFMDPTRWEPTERIVYDDGYTSANATRFEQLQTVGVWDADAAWKLGRYHLAQLRLRPEVYHWGQDIQHLAYQRGDTVELAHDVILVGLKWGRIKEVHLDSSGDVESVEVDELLLMESGETYALKIQRKDGSIVTETIDTVTPSTTLATFDTPIEPNGLEPGVSVGDLFTFGVSERETIEAKITRIEPQGDFKAQITAVPAAENIFDAWTGEIPEFDPVITAPINTDLLPPVQPSIVEVRSESPPTPVGAPNLRMAVAFDMPPGLTGVIVEARIRQVETIDEVDFVGSWSLAGSAPSDAGVVYITNVEETQTYQVQIRSRRGTKVSAWTSSAEHTIGDSGWTSDPGATRNRWRGSWSDGSVEYLVGDVVGYLGRTYICILGHTSDSEKAPSGDTTSNTWWEMFTDRGEDGDDGVALPGPRTATGRVFYQVTSASQPSAPTATAFDFETGAFVGLTSDWDVEAPTFEAGNTNKYWYAYFFVIEDEYQGTQQLTFGTPLQGIGFSGLVTFQGDADTISDGTNTMSFGASGTTQINGGNITTGTINADRIAVGVRNPNPNLIGNPTAAETDGGWWTSKHSRVSRFANDAGTGWSATPLDGTTFAALALSSPLHGVPAVAGRQYTYSGEVELTSRSAGALYLDVIWYDSTPSPILDDSNSPSWSANTSGFERKSHTFTAPSGAAWAIPRVVVSGLVASSARWRKLKFEQAAEATSYTVDRATNLPINLLLGGTFADFIEIASAGKVYSGTKSSFGTGSGWFIGRDGGEPAIDLGDSNAYLRWKASTGLQLKGFNQAVTVTDQGDGGVSATATINRGGGETLILVTAHIAGGIIGGSDPGDIAVTLKRGGQFGTTIKTWSGLRGIFTPDPGGTDPNVFRFHFSGTYLDADDGTGNTTYYVEVTATSYTESTEITVTQTYYE